MTPGRAVPDALAETVDHPRGGRRRDGPGGTGLVEITLRGPPIPHWLQDLETRFGAVVRLHACRATERMPRRLLRLFEITVPAERMPEVAAFLRGQRSRTDVALVRLAPHRLMARVRTPLPALCQSVFEMEGICTSCPFLANGHPDAPESTWSILVPRAGDARCMVQSMASGGGVPPRVVRVGRFRGGRDFTPRQELALQIAFRIGYFETPRRAGLKELAEAMEVSRPTAMELLRRGMLKLAQAHGTTIAATRPLET